MSSNSTRTGHTPDGQSFTVPETPDIFHTLTTPSRCGPVEHLTNLLIALTLLSIPLRSHLPLFLYILNFTFWRLSYNLGLALLLHYQSKNQSLTNWLRASSPSARSLLNFLCTRPALPPYRWQSAPPAFNAWLLFRALSTVILANDGLSYLALACALFRPLAVSTLPTLLLALPTGLALIALSVWSKAAAHNALGDYAWFWGDFFYKVDTDLVFDGVFELFPHPMYTVGYAAYYGVALICRSYTLLLVSLLAHSAQLAFLVLVEEPHIRRIYPESSPAPASNPQPNSPTKEPPVPVEPDARDFDASAPYRPVVAAILAMQTVLVALCATAPPAPALAFAAVVGWRFVHWTACAVLLPKADDGRTPNLWIRFFSRRGSTSAQAFSSWQHLFLLSYVLKHALFVVAVLSTRAVRANSVVGSWAKDWSLVLVGLSLIAVALLSVVSAWSVTGAYGFYYGDFFVTPQNRELVSNGSFRYVTNPEVALGYLAYYGLAVMQQSRSLFLLAAICQGMHMLFVAFVEESHVQREYKFARRSTALEHSVSSLPLVGVLLGAMRTVGALLAGKMHAFGEAHLDSASKEVHVRVDKLRADLRKSRSTIWDRHIVRRASDLTRNAKAQTGIADCEKVISLLEGRGLIVERVCDSEVQ